MSNCYLKFVCLKQIFLSPPLPPLLMPEISLSSNPIKFYLEIYPEQNYFLPPPQLPNHHYFSPQYISKSFYLRNFSQLSTVIFLKIFFKQVFITCFNFCLLPFCSSYRSCHFSVQTTTASSYLTQNKKGEILCMAPGYFIDCYIPSALNSA